MIMKRNCDVKSQFFYKENRQNITLMGIIILERFRRGYMDFVKIFINLVNGIFIGGVQYLPISYEDKKNIFYFFNASEGNEYILIKTMAVLGSSLAIFILFKDKIPGGGKDLGRYNIKLWRNIIIGSIPAIVLSILTIGKGYYLFVFNTLTSIGIIFAGIVCIMAESYYKRKKVRGYKSLRIEKLSLKRIILLGIIQGGLYLIGISPVLAGLIGCWIIGVATGYGITYSLLSCFFIYTIDIASNLLGLNGLIINFEMIVTGLLVLIVSFLTGLISIDMFIGLGKKKSLRIFALINIFIGVTYLL